MTKVMKSFERRQEKYEALKISTLNSMVFLFLRFVCMKQELLLKPENVEQDTIRARLRDELQMLLAHIGSMGEAAPDELKEMVLDELKEGLYQDSISQEDFLNHLQEGIEDILGEMDQHVYNFFAPLIKESYQQPANC